jgi:hypothetical protein
MNTSQVIVSAVSQCGTYKEVLKCNTPEEAKAYKVALEADGWKVQTKTQQPKLTPSQQRVLGEIKAGTYGAGVCMDHASLRALERFQLITRQQSYPFHYLATEQK